MDKNSDNGIQSGGAVFLGVKYPYPDMPAFKDSKKLTEAEKTAKVEVLRVRAESGRKALRDVLAAVVAASDSVTAKDIKERAAEALAFLAERAEGRKGTAGEAVLRAPKSNVVADYFQVKAVANGVALDIERKVGDKIDAAEVFFDLDMDPARVLGSLKRFVSTTKDVSKRVWVSYVARNRQTNEGGFYVISGYGEKKPHDFTAYDVEANAADVA